MIDFHTHVLPGIDDGSKSTDMTLEMLREEMRQGVTQIVCTPHFYSNRMSADTFLKRREVSLSHVKARLDELGEHAPDLRVGAEVYFFSGMSEAARLPELCIEGTNVLLLEMPFSQWDERVYREVKAIISERRLSVVLAHVERYHGFQKKKQIWERVLDLPLTVQLNAGSFQKGLMRRRFCIDMLRARPDSIIGSDCHNLTERPPNIAGAREMIAKKLGGEALAEVDRSAEKILQVQSL